MGVIWCVSCLGSLLALAACIRIVIHPQLVLGGVSWGFWVFDGLSFYLVLLVLILGATALGFNWASLRVSTVTYLGLSITFRVLRFCTKHALLFWGFYELSMLPLLYLIFRDSPYSERYLAG
jgi:NADH:ubiquinone oxidoreductase subunit 4 (subunit M)